MQTAGAFTPLIPCASLDDLNPSIQYASYSLIEPVSFEEVDEIHTPSMESFLQFVTSKKGQAMLENFEGMNSTIIISASQGEIYVPNLGLQLACGGGVLTGMAMYDFIRDFSSGSGISSGHTIITCTPSGAPCTDEGCPTTCTPTPHIH